MSIVPRAALRRLAARLPGPLARVRTHGRTVRLRMTLLYSGLFLLSGAALLAVTYVLVLHAVTPTGTAPATGEGTIPVPVGVGGLPPGAPPDGGEGTRTWQLLTDQLSTVMRSLLVNSLIALALMGVISIVLGWIVAGRMLRPLRTMTGTVRDISATSLHRRLALDGPQDELKQLGDTFDELLDRLESAFRAQRQFVANASHELRTPLSRQRTIGQVALYDPEASAESLRAAHERILVAGEEQERLIEALLILTRGQTGIEVREPFDLARLTAEVLETRHAEAGLRGVTFRSSIGPATAAGHRKLAERLVVNLVDNALKYNHPHGWIEVATWTADDRGVVRVANSGTVVPPDAVEELFQPFRRLGTGRTAGLEGYGLGLSIVRAIADAHDARLDAHARPDGGLSITVAFPCPATPASRPGTAKTAKGDVRLSPPTGPARASR
ncbi:HAMP domain-containing sensor histidine kinase [Actinoplanes sp. NPDC049548]|uniref:sensor histidine kinase n=1 Tax=Actinoplanes sp. NPDC049548 TaxID=3155152 RepID=UPI00343FD9C4